MALNKHNKHSTIREEYVEYIFLAELCSYAWESDRFVEIARAHTDAFGYDLVLNCNGITRHVQLKASVSGGSTARQNINVALAEKESGCILWLVINQKSLKLDGFLWFGGQANAPLPVLGEKTARHSKGNSEGDKLERPNIRVLNKGRFEKLDGIEEVFSYLFGKGT